MQRIVALLLCLVLVAGCGSFHFAAFGISLDDFEGNELSADEKAGTILLVGIVIAAGIVGASVVD